ncbi:uncharacterized protein LOC131070401 isoform X2 [Cryptomeria japonica]|uniref:uncharacterized protein LOC131070401 isoform X2 n=1 Tax=Cryptomeria japonica TaxID=3369 RepID=UPI0027DA2B03|nr:uncharacterized protein LOC131070401 isoform X2 [Cryptomeria japonica]
MLLLIEFLNRRYQLYLSLIQIVKCLGDTFWDQRMSSSRLLESHNGGLCKIQHSTLVMGVARIKTSKPSSRFAVQAAGMTNLYRKITGKRKPATCSLQEKVSAKEEVIIWDFPKRGLDLQPEKNRAQDLIQKIVFNCRYFTLMGVGCALIGSILCFLRGCALMWGSFLEYFHRLPIFKGLESAHGILPLVEAIDIYLLGTVMLIFGIGLYELFISNLHIPSNAPYASLPHRRSSLFGLFVLQRPAWLDVKSVEELTAKVERVMMMIALLSLLDKIKWVLIITPFDLLCFSATILFSSASIFLLSKLSR